MEVLPWLGLWGLPPMWLPGQHFLGIAAPSLLLDPRVEGLEVGGPPSPLPSLASTPWLSQPTAAEFNAGLGQGPAP